MFDIFRLWFGALLRIFRTHQSLLLENLALRQQLTVFKRKHPRPRIGLSDRVFWVVARRFWSNWKHSLLLVTPDTVVRWHRAGFRFYWRLICRSGMRAGGKKIPKEVRDLIFQMVAESPTWGAPPALMANYACWALMCLSEPSPAGCAGRSETLSLPSVGWLFCAITVKPLPPWTSPAYPPSPSTCSTASLLLATTVEKSYTSMSRSTRPAVGLFSIYERHSLISPLPDSSSSITTRSMGWRSRQRFAPRRLLECKPRSKARGRTE